MRFFWNDDRVQELKDLWAEGLSESQITLAMGAATKDTISGKLHRLGLISELPRHPRGGKRTRLPNHTCEKSVSRLCYAEKCLEHAAEGQKFCAIHAYHRPENAHKLMAGRA